MSPLSPALQACLRQAKSYLYRGRVQPMFDALALPAGVGAVTGLAVGWWLGQPWLGWVTALVIPVVPTVLVLRRAAGEQPDDLTAAAWVDKQLGLEERFCSVVQLQQRSPEHPFLPVIQKELEDRLPLDADLPAHRHGWPWRGLAGALLCLSLPCLTWVLPPPPAVVQQRAGKKIDAEAKEALAQAAEEAAEQLEEKSEGLSEEARKALLEQQKQLEELAAKLRREEMDREAALQALREAKDRLTQEQQKLAESHLSRQARARERLSQSLQEGTSRQEQVQAIEDALERHRQEQGSPPQGKTPLPDRPSEPFSSGQSKDLQDALGLDSPPQNQNDLQRQLQQQQQRDGESRRMADALDQAEQALDQWRPDGGTQTAQNSGGQQQQGGAQGGQTGGASQGQQRQQGQAPQGGQQGQGQQPGQGQGQQGGRQGAGASQGGQQAGSGGGAQGQGTSGAGGGQTLTQAGGGSAPDAGTGTTNLDQGAHPTQPRTNHGGRQLDGMSQDWKEAYVRLYEAVKVDREGTTTRVGGNRHEGPQRGELPAIAPYGEEGWTVEASDAVVPPGRGVEEALDNLEVPPGYEDTIRDYFDAISGQ